MKRVLFSTLCVNGSIKISLIDAKRIKLELSLSVPACGSTVYVDCCAQDQTSSTSDSHTVSLLLVLQYNNSRQECTPACMIECSMCVYVLHKLAQCVAMYVACIAQVTALKRITYIICNLANIRCSKLKGVIL